jgi:D-alanyl-D-alanine carboxypeptidase (penicillin-binding protein 5/6)
MQNPGKLISVLFSCVTLIFTSMTFAADTSSTSVFSHLPASTTVRNSNPNLPTPKPNTPIVALSKPTPIIVPNAPVIDANGFILIDANTGKVLASEDPDQRMQPASLTKLMTLYLIFAALHENRIHLTDHVTISENAWHMSGSRMFAQVGTTPTVEELIRGIIVQSGNDACVAMSEYIAGSEDSFVSLMNQQAALLHMNNTHYTDSTGMPHPDHYSTPRDLSTLARALISNFPEYYHYFGEKEFVYNNIKQPNRNRLLWRDPTVDGLKTGHTSTAGYCLVASAHRNGTRLISVVLGAPSDQSRTSDSAALLTYGFNYFESHKIYAANTQITQARVWYGKEDQIPVGLTNDLYVTVIPGQFPKIQVNTIINEPLKAPINKGEIVGNVDISLNGKIIESSPLIALSDNLKANIFVRMFDHMSYLFHKFKKGE